jgi:lysophospholipase L1-like esterase
MEKFTLNFFKIFSVICLIIVLSGKLHFIGYSLIIETDKPEDGNRFSDLYSMCRISTFKEQVSRNTSAPETGNFNEADILIMGDSFLENKLDDKAFKEALQYRTKLKVFDFTRVYPDAVNTPLFFLKKINQDWSKKRILILETIERYSQKRAVEYSKDTRLTYSMPRFYDKLSDDIFHYNDVNVVVRYNYLLRELFNFKSQLNFNVFNQILNKEIGAFSVNPNLLFFYEETNFYKKVKSEEDITDVTVRINNLAKELEKYNIDLVYVIIPDKFSIYNEYIYGRFHENSYIPGVNKKLKQKNIKYIDLYSIFLNNKNKDELLYYSSDTHFNVKGRELLVDECIKKINEIKSGINNIVYDGK